MRMILASGIMIFILGASLFWFFRFKTDKKILSPVGNELQNIIKPLEKYSFDQLRKRFFKPGKLTIDKTLKDEETFLSYLFFFKVDKKRVSGLLNIPKEKGTYPVIVMLRGYVDREVYETGAGTQRAGEVFAQNGFITLAPDFLGYGESDLPTDNVMEDRFMTYTTVLQLLSSIKNINTQLKNASINDIQADENSIGIWGHSNGGQIALTVLEISGKDYPTVLWAPVSKPFPYSILYYTDDIEDHGKALRKVVAKFEKDYDAEKYSLTNYYEWIRAPIQLHQGLADGAVPQKWSDDLYEKLKELEIEVDYYTYPQDDHNFAKGGWNRVVLRNIDFYKKIFLKNSI